MAQHKIQSSTGLTLELEQVPKVLGKLVNEWAPRAFVVSFKLETDESILFTKAWGAIEKYQVHLVVANILHTRADKCFLVEPVGPSSPSGQVGADQVVDQVGERQRSVTTILRNPNMSQIEPALVRKVVQAYWAHLGAKQLHKPARKNDDATRIGDVVRLTAINYVQMITFSAQSSDEDFEDDQADSNYSILPVSLAVLCLGGLGLAYYTGALHPRNFKR